MKRIIISILIFILLLVIIYNIPAPSSRFLKHYGKNDDAAKSYKDFMQIPVSGVKVNGIPWKYVSLGKGKHTLLFIHGMGGAYNLWWQQARFFKDKYRIITFTLPEEIDNLEDTKNGIEAILDKEKVDKFYVIGTSMGGYIAQYLVHSMPERIEKAVFSNTFPPNTIIEKENRKKAKLIRLMPEWLIAKFGEKQLKEKLVPAGDNSKLLEAFLPSLPFNKKQFLNRYKVFTDKFFPYPWKYPYKRIPKLIIESSNDPLVNETLREKLKELYDLHTEVYTFNGGGHFPYINRAAEYNRILDRFFSKPNVYAQAEKTVQKYFAGRKQADTVMLREAFGDDAVLYTLDKGGKKIKIPFETYLKKVAEDGPQKVETKILDGDISGEIAVYKTRFNYGDYSYTDYLQMLNANGKWKITVKTFMKNQ